MAGGDGDGDLVTGDGDGDTVVDLRCATDADCDLPRAASAGCVDGLCTVTDCSTGFRNCDLRDDNGCESPPIDPDNCGGCGIKCEVDHGTAACLSNTCVIDSCDDGWGDCDDAPLDCETRLNSLTDCGACGETCGDDDVRNGTATCETGRCGPASCDDGFADCNAVPVDGCEARTDGTTGCGMCAVGHGECDGIPQNGCEPLNTVTNCGACGDACTPARAAGDCGGGSCLLAGCDADWADCDGRPANGCEQQLSVVGPCFPDDTCVRRLFNGTGYFFCQDARTWDQAQARCRGQLSGDLVRIDDAAEQAFVQGQSGADSWLGGGDGAVEGQWRWSDNGVQFWQGDGGGAATGGAYENWFSGSPDGSGNCMRMRPSGEWDDRSCDITLAYVCEVQGDLCPDDPQKAHPGQCGCGQPDTDGDGDGTADCADACAADAAKIEAGACGCGSPDTDGDGDDTPVCMDECECDGDGSKTTPGQCGCNAPDTDGDGDGTADCNDACALDPASQVAPCGFAYTPANFDPGTLDFGAAPSSTLSCGDVSIDTAGGVTINGWCGAAPTPVIIDQPGGTQAVVLPLKGLSLADGRTIRVTGTRPLILAVRDDADIAGKIDVGAAAETPGPGGNMACTAGTGEGNKDISGVEKGGGGGGGGGFGTAGGAGGAGHRGAGGGAAGAAEGDGTLTPLRGGCAGGRGGFDDRGTNSGRDGGGGGGALQISAGTNLWIRGTAVLAASGGGGQVGVRQEDGGGGGGSGGGILLQGAVVDLAAGAWVTAHGGGGGSGNSNDNVNGSAGSDGAAASGTAAGGGMANQGSGNGGAGGVAGLAPTVGAAGQNPAFDPGAGGGGGGGAVGRIRIHGGASCTGTGSAQISPAALVACP